MSYYDQSQQHKGRGAFQIAVYGREPYLSFRQITFLLVLTLFFHSSYKSMDEIVSQIEPTAEIIQRIRPVYNFKAAD